MFRKIYEAYSNLNLEKTKRDAWVAKERIRNNTSKLKHELKYNWSFSKLNEQIPKYQKLYQQKTKPNLGNLDKLYSNYRDKFLNSFSERTSKSQSWLKGFGLQAFQQAKKSPFYLWRTAKSFGSETKNYFKSSYLESRAHIKNYLARNSKLFAHYRFKAFEVFRKKRRTTYMMLGCGIFLYAVGSSIPKAVADYKLRQQELSNNNG